MPGVGESTRAIAIGVCGGNSSGKGLTYSPGASDREDGLAVVEGADDLLRRIQCCSEPLSIGVGDADLVGASTRCRNGIGGCCGIGDGSAALEPLVGVVGT